MLVCGALTNTGRLQIELAASSETALGRRGHPTRSGDQVKEPRSRCQSHIASRLWRSGADLPFHQSRSFVPSDDARLGTSHSADRRRSSSGQGESLKQVRKTATSGASGRGPALEFPFPVECKQEVLRDAGAPRGGCQEESWCHHVPRAGAGTCK